jgi:hypothetical protein
MEWEIMWNWKLELINFFEWLVGNILIF